MWKSRIITSVSNTIRPHVNKCRQWKRSDVLSRTYSKSKSSKSSFGRLLLKVGGVGAAVGATFVGVVMASDDVVHPYPQNWSHKGFLSAFDTASLRRGYEVYRQVCSTCHSLTFIKFRNLIGATHTEEQAKALAASYTIKDGPNDEGEMFERPGKLSDGHPQPYPNPEFARYANGGALPPDLSLVSKARFGGEDYVYSLLTGYTDPPAGVELREGLHYNPHFPGGAISMAPPLQDDGCEYEDDTPPNISQMAKDVSTFLAWASEPETNERKLFTLKMVTLIGAMIVSAGYMKRRLWSIHKTRKISYRPIKKPYSVYTRGKSRHL